MLVFVNEYRDTWRPVQEFLMIIKEKPKYVNSLGHEFEEKHFIFIQEYKHLENNLTKTISFHSMLTNNK